MLRCLRKGMTSSYYCIGVDERSEKSDAFRMYGVCEMGFRLPLTALQSEEAISRQK